MYSNNVSATARSMATYGMPQSNLNQSNLFLPTVVEKSDNGERSYDLYSRLMKERIVLFSGEVRDEMANIAMAQLLFLEYEDSEKPIFMYINSPGGSVSAGMGVFDVMRKIKSPVVTVCTGLAASMGAFLLAAGDVRMSLPNARVMIHQPLGGASGQATEIEISAREILKTREKMNQYLAEFSGQPIEKIRTDTERDYWLTAEESLEYGLVDVVHKPAPKEFNREDIIKSIRGWDQAA